MLQILEFPRYVTHQASEFNVEFERLFRRCVDNIDARRRIVMRKKVVGRLQLFLELVMEASKSRFIV